MTTTILKIIENIKHCQDLKINNHNLSDHNYLFLILHISSENNQVKLGTFQNYNDNNMWIIENNTIKNNKNEYLGICNYKLIVSTELYEWKITNDCLQSVTTTTTNTTTNTTTTDKLFISCDQISNYEIYLTLDQNNAIPFHFYNNLLCYVKPQLLVDFEKHNFLNNLNNLNNLTNLNNLNNLTNIKKNQNIGIILAAGNSTRFNKSLPKQIFELNNKPIICYSIDSVVNILDKIVIVTSTYCFETIQNIINNQYKSYDNIDIVINDFNCRLKSIETGLAHIKNNYDINTIKNIIIHDSARPYINTNHIVELINLTNLTNLTNDNNQYMYSQYCLKLTNGLMTNDCNIVNRDNYVELCTPLCINYDLCQFIFDNYIKEENRITYEFLPILKLLKIKYILIDGNISFLKKITTSDDI